MVLSNGVKGHKITEQRTGEESVKIFDLVVRGGTLPEKVEDLAPLSFIGNAAVKYYQTKIKLMDQLGMTEEQRKATLKDGQDAGEMLLEIEARIGELLPSVDEIRQKVGDGQRGIPKTLESRGSIEYPENLTAPRRKNARAIHRNPEAVAAIIKEAKENDDIPTKTAVLNKIKYEKEKARKDTAIAEGRTQKTEIELRIEEQQYIQILESIISRLPKTPPQDWSDKFFRLAKGYANIIINRLEVFNG